MVFKTSEYVKRSVGGSGSEAVASRVGYEVVVIASCKTPHERLVYVSSRIGFIHMLTQTYNAAYIPATQMKSCIMPGESAAESRAAVALACTLSGPFPVPLAEAIFCFSDTTDPAA